MLPEVMAFLLIDGLYSHELMHLDLFRCFYIEGHLCYLQILVIRKTSAILLNVDFV